MNDHFNKLNRSEDERLACLMEECGEVIQAIGKIMRHGYGSHDPTVQNSPNNRAMLTKEIGDVLACINMLFDSGDVSVVVACRNRDEKLLKMRKYLHHQEDHLAFSPDLKCENLEP